MKHLPTHQPNRSRFALVFLLFMTFLLGSVQGWGQVASATWALTSNGIASVSGNVAANSITIGSGISNPVYDGTIGISTGSWSNDAGNRVTDEYYEYKVTPSAGNSFNVTTITGEHSRSSGNWITAAFYSLNDFSSETQIGSNINIASSSSTPFSYTGLNISVPAGATLTVRIYAWESDGSNRSYRNKNIVISGTTTCVPAISSQSTSAQSVCAGTSFAPISVTASGTNLTYQWYRNTSANNSGGTSLGTATGAQTSTYTPLNNVASGTNYYYYCVVSNGCGSVTSSVSGAFLVSSASSVGTIQTSAVSVCSGSSTTLILSTPNTGSIQWQQSTNGTSGWSSVVGGSGATSTNYTTSQLSTTTYYRARVTNGACAAVYSNIASVTVNQSVTPTFTAVSAICSGASLSALPTTSNNGYEGIWSPALSNTATNTYTFTPTAGQCASTTTMTITVNPTPTALSISPIGATICNGDIQSLEVSGGIGGTPNAVLTSTAASGSVNLAIPDNSSTGVSNTLAISSIPLNGTITKIDVTLNLTHAWLNDVEITLTAPNGKVIALAADQGPGAQGSYSNTVITSDNAAPVLSTTVTPITGTFRANATASGTLIGGTFGGNLTQIFSDLFSIQNGSWKITAFDDAAQDLGTLDSWSIAITYSTPQIIWSPTTGLYTNAPATTSYTGSPSATVYAKPTETITYTATATSSAGCTSSNTVEVIVNNPTTYYADADGDTFGNPAVSTSACAQPTGYVTDNTDCNDNNASIKPAPFGLEVCNSIDDDCDGLVDDGLGTNSYFQDSDNDTFGNPSVSVVSCAQPSGYVLNNSDCNDNNATISYNVYYADADGDSFGDQESTTQGCSTQTGYVSNYTDCDDTKSAVNPNATEICNEFDDDCDGLVNEGVALSDYHQDSDGDGYGSGTAVSLCQPTAGYVQNSLDCNDTNASANPNGQEICGNDIDEDCSGVDLYPSFYVSVAADGNWRQASTWNYSCDNSNFLAANYAPPANYTGDVLIAANTTVTVTKFPTASQTGILRIAANGNLVLEGNQATNAPTAANVGQIAKLTVLNGIVNNGTLTIGHHASLLQTGATANSGNGNFVVNVEFTGNNNGAATPAPNGRYWYLGSPMNNTNAGSTFLDPSNMVRLWGYNGSLNSWEVIVHSGTGATTSNTLIPGIGYLYRAGNNETVTYTGNAAAFNNNITSNLLQPTVTSSMVPLTGYQSSTGYKFVANPYMSHIDWKLVTRTGLNVSYWIRNASNTAYESYNATSGVSNSPSGQTIKDIPPMQGFWVYAFNTSPSLVINNGDRVHSSNVVHAPIHNQIVRLNLNDGKTDDQAVVYENDNANNGIEEFDTDKFMDENYHQVYFLEGSKQLSLDGLKDATAKQKVDMGIQITSAGTYTINAVELGVEEDVVLEDKFTHTFQDLKRNSSYSFTSNAGTFNNRFVLHFTLNPQTETSMESVAVTEEVTEVEGVQVYTTTGQQVKVWVTNTSEFQNATVKVYDAVGNMIERKNMTSNELLLDLDIANGIYVVEVTGVEKTFIKKVFIGK